MQRFRTVAPRGAATLCKGAFVATTVLRGAASGSLSYPGFVQAASEYQKPALRIP
jgi:hypothetical protein